MGNKAILRRAPQGRVKDFKHSLQFAAGFLLILLLIINAPNAAYRYLWLDLQDVAVPDHLVGSDPQLVIARRIIMDHDATYTVTIREAETHAHVCSVSPDIVIPYKRSASDKTPVLTADLSHWLDDPAALRKCETKGFGAGRFYLNTCHFKVFWGFQVARRCVASNIFERIDPQTVAQIRPPSNMTAREIAK